MKCPNCSYNHPKREGMRCGKCGYEFVFRPDIDGGWADGKFLGLVKAASSQETNYVTANQLYTTYCRRKQRISPRKAFIVFLVLAVIAVGLYVSGSWEEARRIFGVVLGVGALIAFIVFLVALKNRHIPPPRDRFDGLLQQWTRKKGAIEKLVTEKRRLQEPPPDWKEADMYDYGVERLLIVQRDMLVDLLVLNGFHAQERTLVISAKGYPDYLLPQVKKVLAENPELPVFLLHDSTKAGVAMATSKQLQRLPSFEGHPVIDLGIFPEDVPLIRRIRPTKPKNFDYEIPVDLIPYTMLSSMLAEAMAKKVSFREAIVKAQEADSQGDDYFSGDSFG